MGSTRYAQIALMTASLAHANLATSATEIYAWTRTNARLARIIVMPTRIARTLMAASLAYANLAISATETIVCFLCTCMRKRIFMCIFACVSLCVHLFVCQYFHIVFSFRYYHGACHKRKRQSDCFNHRNRYDMCACTHRTPLNNSSASTFVFFTLLTTPRHLFSRNFT